MTLEVELEKKYGSFRLHTAFTAESGRPLALLGASGSGKSVTLRCIAGVERPDRGRIVLDGQVLFDSGQHIRLTPQKRRIGLLFSHYALFPHMTAEENIAVCLRHLDRTARRQRTAELLALLRLQDVAGLRPGQLSNGQQQRTALARMLASEPRAILLDEPFSALDSGLQWELEEEFRTILSRFDGPVIWVSHDRGEVCRNCRDVCILDQGQSAPVCSVRDFLDHPQTVCAARLAGCRTCVPAEPGPGLRQIWIPAWQVRLEAKTPWRLDTAAVGIQPRRVALAAEGERNAIRCRVGWVAKDASMLLAALEPVDALPGAPPLWMELDRETELAAEVWAAVAPEHLHLLTE